MWTPKRILILVTSFLGLLGVYYVYGLVLGRYDGLRPLPADHLPSASPSDTVRHGPETVESSAVRKLKLAFGANCREAHRPIQLELKNQGVVIAAGYWRLLDNGNLGFDQVSVAVFGKPTADGRPGEINTIRGVRAEIRFDQPLRTLRDANDKNRRAVGGRLEGGYDKETRQPAQVHLQNNRRTPEPDDDLHLFTDWLEFLDDQRRIWTEAPVELVEGVRPQATVVTARGMEVLLLPGDAPPAPASGRRPRTTIAGVKSVRLDSAVRMDLLIDKRSAFLAGPNSADPAADVGPLPRKPEKSRLIISSRGPFLYGIGPDADRAEFTDQVEVIRPHGVAPADDDQDELKCSHLVLQFQRRNPDEKRRIDDAANSLDLVHVHAVGNPLELTSQAKATEGKPAEKLQALAAELIFDKKADQTSLKGNPLEAVKDGHQLRLKGTLILQNVKKEGEPQEVRAVGPGEARLKGRDGNPNIIARWQEEFHSSKEGDLDRVVLLGKASFTDPDPDRGTLSADKLLVKLATVPGYESAGDKKRRVPRFLQATDNVALKSRKLVIAHADRLQLDFVDAGSKPVGGEGLFAGVGGRLKASERPDYLPGADHAHKPPLVLAARTIDARLIRIGGQNELDSLETDGRVRVFQEAGPATDAAGKPIAANKELRIEGERLRLDRTADGNKLRVVGRGEPEKTLTYQPAFVQLDRLRLIGPSIEIDQPNNVVYVAGPGSMKMPTRTDFQGNSLKEAADVTIDWNERMLFDGRYAQFYGGVSAVQGVSSLAGQELHVELEQPVSLKERSAGGADQAGSLRRLMAYGKVCLEKKARQGDKWLEFQRIEGSQLVFEKSESRLIVSGPGHAYYLQTPRAAPDPQAAPLPPAIARPGGGETKLTRIEFSKQMMAAKADDRTTDTIEFSGEVRLVNFPTENPDAAIDEDRLPPGAFALRCKQLKAWGRKADGKNSNDFLAIGEVVVRAREAKGQEFLARADQATYDEAKDLLILKSDKSVTIWRQQQPGGEYETVSAKKIWYWRKENRIQTEQTTDIGVKP